MWVLALERPVLHLHSSKLGDGVFSSENLPSRTTILSCIRPGNHLSPLTTVSPSNARNLKTTKKLEQQHSEESKLRRLHQLSNLSILPTQAKLVFCLRNNNEIDPAFEPLSDLGEERRTESKNSVVWTAKEIAQAVGGTLVQTGGPGRICTDTRRIEPGDWFLPLVGSKYDGHDFLHQALKRGCHGVVGKAVHPGWPVGFVSVENGDTLGALQRLATFRRERFGGPVVGITGSVGKTTTRAMTVLALESLGVVHGTEGNFNNHIGVPLTLLKLATNASSCVLEMGMSHAGEIQKLVEIASPSVRVLMNVSVSHMENFRSLEDVAAAKGEIMSHARSGDVCVLNADDPLVMSLPLPPKVRLVLFGRQLGCHLRIADAQSRRNGMGVQVVLEQLSPSWTWVENPTSGSKILQGLRELFMRGTKERASSKAGSINNKTERKDLLCHSLTEADYSSAAEDQFFPSRSHNLDLSTEFEIPSPGLHLAENACAAAAVAVTLGVPLEAVGSSLSKFVAPSMRAKREELGGGIQLIDDAYNANPMSMASGLRLLGSMTVPGRRVALLGDMLELGSASKKAHTDALELCQELKLDVVGLVGPLFFEAAQSRQYHRDNQEYLICRTSEELSTQIAQKVKSSDAVLVKGSRGLRMDKVADAVREIGTILKEARSITFSHN